MTEPVLPPADITGLLLAGGRGTRMGGSDKGLLPLANAPLAEHVLARLRPQVGALLINANRHSERWREFGLPLVADDLADFPGPLAGIHAGLGACTTPWLLSCPCDTPFIPTDLAQRLAAAAVSAGSDLAVARCDGRPQPVFMLLRSERRAAVAAFLASGERRVGLWLAQSGAAYADFTDATAFANINTPQELAAATRALTPAGANPD